MMQADAVLLETLICEFRIAFSDPYRGTCTNMIAEIWPVMDASHSEFW